MSAVAIALIVVAALLVLLFVGGLVASRRRAAAAGSDFDQRLAEADRALEAARAADKGWDRPLLEEAARQALADQRPGFSYEALDLVLVDDRPGVAEDRAHFVAAGSGEDVRVILARRDDGWVAEHVG